MGPKELFDKIIEAERTAAIGWGEYHFERSIKPYLQSLKREKFPELYDLLIKEANEQKLGLNGQFSPILKSLGLILVNYY